MKAMVVIEKKNKIKKSRAEFATCYISTYVKAFHVMRVLTQKTCSFTSI